MIDTVERELRRWFLDVHETWDKHWSGVDHRYGRDFAAFVGERLMQDFGLRAATGKVEASDRDAVFEECIAILNTLVLGGYARPQSLLAVLRDEIHPEIRRMREALLEIGGIADGVTARAATGKGET